MTKQEKDLSFAQIKKENAKRYNNKKRIHFDNGYKLDIDTVFQPSKLEVLVQEFLTVLFNTHNRNEELDEASYNGLISLLTIKYFTSLKTDADDLHSYIALVESLKDGEYFDKIVETFDKNEVDKVFNAISTTLIRGTETLKEIEKQKNALDELGNADTKEEEDDEDNA